MGLFDFLKKKNTIKDSPETNKNDLKSHFYTYETAKQSKIKREEQHDDDKRNRSPRTYDERV